MYLLYPSTKDIICMATCYSQARAALHRCKVTGSIQCAVIPKKLLLWAVHMSTVVETYSTFSKASLTRWTISSYNLSKYKVKDFLSGTCVQQRPPINFQNAGDSTVDNGSMSSITYCESKLRSLVDGTLLLDNVHCFFGWLASE